MTITITIESNFPRFRAYRLYYGYITTVIIMIEKVVSDVLKLATLNKCLSSSDAPDHASNATETVHKSLEEGSLWSREKVLESID